MSQRFAGKVVLVTGGGTGIGRTIARAFLAEGAKVAVTGRRKEPLAGVASEGNGRLLPVVADVTIAADRRRVIERVVGELGRLDILVNNAGVFVGKPLAETSDEEIAQTFGVNVLGLIAMTREALPALERTKGSIVSVSSVVATGVFLGSSVYSASKAAVDQFTRLLAAELGPRGIRVNAVSPGVTESEMTAGLLGDDAGRKGIEAQTPLGRIGKPEDIASVALFLASDEARWVTGQALQASGGLLL
jgi:meso-butanediol dehydrogenase/(S,S)-butanediol dehydrogenase/diacetyl reductase